MAKTVPYFEPEMIKSGRWFVAVTTGNGPDSHIGDFETEAEAKSWILTKSKYWPGKLPKRGQLGASTAKQDDQPARSEAIRRLVERDSR
jgi:hypothetical protein